MRYCKKAKFQNTAKPHRSCVSAHDSHPNPLFTEATTFVYSLHELAFCSAVDSGSPDIHRIFGGNSNFFL
jgi:hypothetical protein